MLTLHQLIVCQLIAALILLLIINFIRKGILAERYSYLWVVFGIIIVLLPMNYDAILFLSKVIGAKLPVTTILFFFSCFVILLLLQICINISSHSQNMKNLLQKVTLLDYKVQRMDEQMKRLENLRQIENDKEPELIGEKQSG